MSPRIKELRTSPDRGEMRRGPWLVLGPDPVADIAWKAGFEQRLIDAENAPFDPMLIRRQSIVPLDTATEAVDQVPMSDCRVQGMDGPKINATECEGMADFPATDSAQITGWRRSKAAPRLVLDAFARTDGVDCVSVGLADPGAGIGCCDRLDARELSGEMPRGVRVICTGGNAAGPTLSGLQKKIELSQAGLTCLGIGTDTEPPGASLLAGAEGRK